MLDSVLKFFADEVNGYLRARTGVIQDAVTLSAIIDEKGKYAIEDDSIGLYIINIEEDSHRKSQIPETTYTNGQHAVLAPALKLNLTVMFAANYKHHDQALKYTSLILTYFQSHHLFTHTQYSAMDEKLEQLTVELQSLNFDQLNQIWAYIGAKQLPSVIYKIRGVSIQDQAQNEVRPPIQHINTDVGSI